MWRFTILAFLLIGLHSCKPVEMDYDSRTNFTKYKTYNYYPKMRSGLNELNDSRMRRAVDQVLREKGFVKSNNPDVLINYYTKQTKKPSYSSLGVGVGRSIGRRGGINLNTRVPIGGNRKLQQITFDIIDKEQDKMVWQGAMKADVKEGGSVASRDAQYLRNISKLLRNFPPNKR